MATTNWRSADALQSDCPHTFNALQHLVTAMARVGKNRGKKSLFGRDKGLAAYKKFEEKLKDTLLALVLDGAMTRNESPGTARAVLLAAIGAFEKAFPNWQDAYLFAHEYLVDSAAAAEERIASALR